MIITGKAKSMCLSASIIFHYQRADYVGWLFQCVNCLSFYTFQRFQEIAFLLQENFKIYIPMEEIIPQAEYNFLPLLRRFSTAEPVLEKSVIL